MSEGQKSSNDPLAQRLAALREEFDASFARPWDIDGARADSILCFTADGLRFAVLAASLRSLSRCHSLISVPSRSAALLGLAVLHAQAVPVYSLPRLTGASAPQGECQWLALLRGPAAVALAVGSLDGYAEDTEGPTGVDGHSPYVRGLVKHKDCLYAMIDAAKLYQAITQQSSE